MSDILAAVLEADTDPGYTLTIGSDSTPIAGDVTVSTGESGTTIILKGKLD